MQTVPDAGLAAVAVGFQPSEPARYFCGVYAGGLGRASICGRLALTVVPGPVFSYSSKRAFVQTAPDMSLQGRARLTNAPMVDSR